MANLTAQPQPAAHRRLADRSIFATMRPALIGALALSAACSRPGPTPPPRAEFLVSAGDSTYWVTSGPSGIRLRGSPLLLARLAGRFHEVFVADDERSYDDALFIGERVYRRDLVTDDSAVVFTDTVVPRAERSYSFTHPNAELLGPDDDGVDDPSTIATAQVDVIDVHGPHLSYAYRVEMLSPDAAAWHMTRRGVLNLASGKPERATDLLDDSTAHRVVARARTEFAALRDSIHRDRTERGERAAVTLSGFRFDEASFAITTLERGPALAFAPPGRGGGTPGVALTFPPIVAGQPHWWREVRGQLPTSTDGDSLDRWRRPGYDVIARYDSTGERAHLAIRDSMHAEWPIATVSAPVHHMFWLDGAGVDSAQRIGLRRAFEGASLYDENTRSAAARGSSRAARLMFVSARNPRRTLFRQGAVAGHSRHRAGPAHRG